MTIQYQMFPDSTRQDSGVFNTNKYININMSSVDVYQYWNYRDRFIVISNKGAPV
jgi:hypothetical protein